jgi:hypothetical protein
LAIDGEALGLMAMGYRRSFTSNCIRIFRQ